MDKFTIAFVAICLSAAGSFTSTVDKGLRAPAGLNHIASFTGAELPQVDSASLSFEGAKFVSAGN